MSAVPDMVGYVTRDLRAALDFYRALGLPVPENAHLNAAGEPEQHVEVQLGGYRLAWDSEELMRTLNPQWEAPRGGRVSVAFKTASPAEVDELYTRMTGLGYGGRQAPYDAFWGQRYATLIDPDGNAVDLFCPLSRAGEGEERDAAPR